MRIRVEASGVNFADIVGRMGFYPDLPSRSARNDQILEDLRIR